jgi:hypothetical protein
MFVSNLQVSFQIVIRHNLLSPIKPVLSCRIMNTSAERVAYDHNNQLQPHPQRYGSRHYMCVVSQFIIVCKRLLLFSIVHGSERLLRGYSSSC